MEGERSAHGRASPAAACAARGRGLAGRSGGSLAPGGFAEEDGRDDKHLGRDGFAAEKAKKERDGLGDHGLVRAGDGREGWVEEFGELVIADADDRDVGRNAAAEAAKDAVGADGEAVGDGEETVHRMAMGAVLFEGRRGLVWLEAIRNDDARLAPGALADRPAKGREAIGGRMGE